MSHSNHNNTIAQYDTVWHFADFWPGEYPRRFSIIDDNVVLTGREEMKLTSPKNVICPVPKYATFSPWNQTRNEADNLKYRTVAKVSTVTMTDSVAVPALTELTQNDVTLDIKKDETLDFLVYHAEGFALYRYRGENYIISEGDFAGKASFEENLREDDLWIELPADNGGRGWVLYSDAIAMAGVVETEIEGFGIANDLPDPTSLKLEEISFAGGLATLTDGSKQILDELALKLRQVAGVRFEISGHTDSLGSQESNLSLSQSRADAVVDYLVNRAGVNPALLNAVGYGEAHPIADNGTAEGRAKNRRVEMQKEAS